MEKGQKKIIPEPDKLIPKPQDFNPADSVKPIHFEVTNIEEAFPSYSGMMVETEEEHNQRIGNIVAAWFSSIGELLAIYLFYIVDINKEVVPVIIKILTAIICSAAKANFVISITNTIKYYARKSGKSEEAIALFKQLKEHILGKKKENDGKIHR